MEISHLYQLAQRLLSSAPPGQGHSEPQLLVGGLPEEFPSQISMPESTRLLGSLVQESGRFQVVLETELSPDSILDYYRRAVGAVGGRELKMAVPLMSGTASVGSTGTARFRLPVGNRLLVVVASLVGERLTDVRLHLLGGQDDERSGSGTFNVVDAPTVGGQSTVWSTIGLPFLEPPAGVEEFSTFHGLDSMGRFLTLTLSIHLAAQALASHFGEQLTRAGWRQSSRGANGQSAWSTWEVADGANQVRGYLCIQEWPGTAARRLVYLRIER
ncbi:hypothetical protein [Gloeobacter violaceus]|uniref:hypothetical protein n=1 Tax=Gloeobacter violaceus TaxID=33072 RepID=UPI0013E8CA38|nr:hypothetical protein [Gloeobacter violaceus]